MHAATLPTASSSRTARRRLLALSLGAVSIIVTRASQAADAVAPEPPLLQRRDLSLRNEVQHAVDRGLDWLAAHQNSNGWWSTPDQPAVSALALTAFKGDPQDRYLSPEPAGIREGYRFLLECVQTDGGIHRTNLVTYNTSVSMVALVAARNPAYDPVLRQARRFLVGLQRNFGEKGRADGVFDGGIGYGSRYEHSDMGNTLAALEALSHTRYLLASDSAAPATPDLDWAAAIHFLENCQNLPAYNRQSWASDDARNKGGFVYYPGYSMAGSETNAGRVALRSYGSISYGGLLSYIYADLPRNDPRVVAVFDWLRRNYTLQENPGLGPQGLYYYFHTLTKALNAYGVDRLDVGGGRTIDWRRELARRLIDLQQRDGSWANDNGRWWERDPALVTSYAVLSLEILWRGL